MEASQGDKSLPLSNNDCVFDTSTSESSSEDDDELITTPVPVPPLTKKRKYEQRTNEVRGEDEKKAAGSKKVKGKKPDKTIPPSPILTVERTKNYFSIRCDHFILDCGEQMESTLEKKYKFYRYFFVPCRDFTRTVETSFSSYGDNIVIKLKNVTKNPVTIKHSDLIGSLVKICGGP